MNTITAELIQALADSRAMDAALVRYDDGRYLVRSTVRDADGQEPGHGYEIVATQQGLDDYCDGDYTSAMAADVAHAWATEELYRVGNREVER